MIMRLTVSAMLLAGLVAAAGCSSTVGQLQEAGDRNYMRYAMGKPYAQIAAQNPMSLAGMAGATVYGPMIGSYALAGGDTVYRHIDNVESSTTNVDAGLLLGSESVATRYRLAYFRVGPDGIVKDWATGTLPGERLGCTWYVGGIIRQCSSDEQRLQSLAVYDSLVKTSGDQPLGAWGTPAGPAPERS